MGYYRTQIKKVTFNNETFTLINDSPSPYNNEHWHHLEIIYKGIVLVKLQSPSRKLFYEALKRCLLVCINAENWTETIWVNMDIPGKHEEWERKNQEDMEKSRLEHEAKMASLPHYVPTIADLLMHNQLTIEDFFKTVMEAEINAYNGRTDKELDESMYFAVENLKYSMRDAKSFMIQGAYQWLKEKGFFDNPSNI